MKYLIALAAILFVGGFLDGAYEADEFRHFNDWSKQEKLAFTSFVALQAIDIKQTVWGLKQKRENGTWMFREANPVYGARPSTGKVVAIQAIATLGTYYVLGKAPKKARRKFFMVMIPIKLAVIVRNNHIGLTFSKVI